MSIPRCKTTEGQAFKTKLAHQKKKAVGGYGREPKPVEPIADAEELLLLSETARAAVKHLDERIQTIGDEVDRGALRAIVNFTILVAKVVDQKSGKAGSNPKLSAAWRAKREAAKFKVNSSFGGDFEIIGWSSLLDYTGLQESYLRNKFAQGKGTFSGSRTAEDGDVNYFTITRL